MFISLLLMWTYDANLFVRCFSHFVVQKSELLLQYNLRDVSKGKLIVSGIFKIFLFIYKRRVAKILNIMLSKNKDLFLF
jgi:hypothetical protein